MKGRVMDHSSLSCTCLCCLLTENPGSLYGFIAIWSTLATLARLLVGFTRNSCHRFCFSDAKKKVWSCWFFNATPIYGGRASLVNRTLQINWEWISYQLSVAICGYDQWPCFSMALSSLLCVKWHLASKMGAENVTLDSKIRGIANIH